MGLRTDRFGGELRARAQRIGEYVPAVDALGRNIPQTAALRERHELKALPKGKDAEVRKTVRLLKRRGGVTTKILAQHRLGISKQARRKPAPTMRLANYEFRDVIREHKAEKAKPLKQKIEEEQERVRVYWERKSKKLAPEREKRLPLKHPANL